MLLRLFFASGLSAGLALAAWLLYLPVSPAAEIARNLSGESWYKLSLDGRHLGYWHTSTTRKPNGNWVFESEQRFALNPGNPVATRNRRVFEGIPPHPLISAAHQQTRRGRREGVEIEQSGAGYKATRFSNGDPISSEPLGLLHSLADYLRFELWLDAGDAEPGAIRTVSTLDFERTALINRSFKIVSKEPSGYVIENAAPLAATKIRLDDRYSPVEVEIAGLFNLRASSRAEALAPRSALQTASYFIPTDQPLADHTSISKLVVAIEGHPSPQAFFPSIREQNGQWVVSLNSNALSGQPAEEDLSAETLTYPTRHPDIVALATKVTRQQTTEKSRAEALNRFVHEYLDYQPGSPPRPVLTLLTDQRGDCTEFADLLTTLARAAGLQSRTIFGLAYADTDQPAFAFHAWTEILVDGNWIAMDPTWGQSRIDATHIPLPNDNSAAMQLLMGSVSLAFSILEVEHFSDR